MAWLFSGRGYVPARIALGLSMLVAAAGALAGAATGSMTAGCVMFVTAASWLVLLWRRIGTAKQSDTALPRWVAVALVLVPLATTAGRLTLVESTVASSRDRAIANAAAIIADIEGFHARTGAYPVALSSLWPDYLPGIVGIERYRYEPSGAAYNLYFQHPPADPATQEIVMYNPRGEQDFSSHAADLLQLSPDEIRRQRGYFTSRDLPQRNWRRFLFD
jgi:hypothetical protein